jgi:hypothetical protein
MLLRTEKYSGLDDIEIEIFNIIELLAKKMSPKVTTPNLQISAFGHRLSQK